MKQSNNETMTTTHFESLYPADSRFEEIEKVLACIKAGQSCQVIGLPGVGRSNLLRLLAFNHHVRVKHLGEGQTNFHFLYLDFAEVKGKPVEEVHKFLFLALIESFKERGFQKAHGEAERLFQQSLTLADPLVLFQNLKKTLDILTNQLGISLIFLFDRFEEYLPGLTPEFFSNLRLLRNIAKYRFSVILALSRPLEKLLEVSVYKEFYEFLVGHHVFLPLYDLPGMDFRLNHLEEALGKKLTPSLRGEILKLTGGHGKLTRVCAETLLAQPPAEGEKLEDFLLTGAQVRGSLFEIWSSLNSEEKEALREIAAGGQREKDGVLEFLRQLDLIEDDEGVFRPTIPLLATYLQIQVSFTEEKIYFRQDSGEILKGEKVISDGLSPQEFRLLKFLLQNPGRVCEREEIIQAVWPETKTTAGISDEAIDQMVFRLRKKTEDDPKTPKHLQTVKGRGFRFLP